MGSCISFILRLIMTRRKGKWTGRGSLSLKYDRGWFESKSDVILFFFGER